MLKDAYPAAAIVFYQRGAIQLADAGWQQSDFFGLGELAGVTDQCYSVALYSSMEWGACEEAYRRTCNLAESHNVANVVPIVTPGYTLKRTIDNGASPPLVSVPTFASQSRDIPYPLENSYTAGRQLNNPAASSDHEDIFPAFRAPFVILYPDQDLTNAAQGSHFLSYCRGAAAVAGP